jgi:uncharacterized protein (TIGR02271 family)
MASDKNRTNKAKDENRDPISGTPGAHPVGTGVGAAAGGVAGGAGAAAAIGAATGTTVGGPAGTVAGAAVGAVVGGLVGKGVAEKINPTAEDAYWREHHRNEPYYDKSYAYEDYQGAYRTGYEGYGRWGGQGKSYDEVEPELQKEYQRNYGKSKLSWDKARYATRAAWSRLDRDLTRYIGYDVVDRNDSKIGKLDCLWSDHTGEPAFMGVHTGWIFGKTHVVPAQSATVSERSQKIRLPYEKDKVKDAPAFESGSELDEAKEWEVCTYYGLTTGQRWTGQSERRQGARETRPSTEQREKKGTAQEATIKLSEEELKVGKREVEAGGVRLRKIVRTETVNQPVQLKREEIVIERVPAGQQGTSGQAAFSGEEVYIPLRREEVVIEKEARVREEVRVRKQSQTDEQQVSENVRREDLEIEETGEARRRTPAEEIRERQELPRSQRRRE